MDNDVRILRRAAGMNQADFARAIGRSVQMLQLYERGQAPPPPEVLAKMKAVAAGSTASPSNTTELPEDMLDSIRRHWDEPGFRECVLALVRIWEVGDEEVEDSIARNCRTFARMSNLLEGTHHDHGDTRVGTHEQRMAEILEDAKEFKRRAGADAEVPADAGGSGARSKPVGDRPVPSARRKGK